MLARICLNGVFVCVFVFVCVVLCGFIEKGCGTHTQKGTWGKGSLGTGDEQVKGGLGATVVIA